MPSLLRTAFILGLPAASLCAVPRDHGLEQLKNTFEGVPAASARAVLQDTLSPKYRDGVFADQHKALEAVHSDDPSLASKLVDAVLAEMQKHDLRRRQDNNTTTSAVVTSTSTTQVTTPISTTTDNNGGGGVTSTANGGSGDSTSAAATTTGVVVPITQTTTNNQGQTETQTTSAFQASAETSAVVAVTSTDDSGNQVVTSTTVPAQAVETTNDQGQTITSAQPVSAATVAAGGSIVGNGNGENNNGGSITGSYSSGEIVTTTNARGRTVVFTYTPSGGQVSQVIFQTTRLANGEQSTITSFAIVGGETNTRGGAGGNGQATSTGGKPGLVSGSGAEPTPRYGGVAAVIGGAVGLAALL